MSRAAFDPKHLEWIKSCQETLEVAKSCNGEANISVPHPTAIQLVHDFIGNLGGSYQCSIQFESNSLKSHYKVKFNDSTTNKLKQ